MIGKWLHRFVRRRHRMMVVMAMLPLVVLNAVPVSAGCRCADGHVEPICNAARCLAGKGDCGCLCCAEGGCKNGTCPCCMKKAERCADETADPSSNDGRESVRGSGCCTPIFRHQAAPTVLTSPKAIDDYQMSALASTIIEVFVSAPAAKIVRHVDFDTGPPPRDFVVVFQRLLI